MIIKNIEFNMKIQLKSNFRQTYDYLFDKEGVVFERFTDGGPSRSEMIGIFKEIGLKTPLFGKFGDFVKSNYQENRYVVVYTNENQHCGEGKERKLFGRLSDSDKNCYLMEYIDTCNPEEDGWFSKSTRYLFVGNDIGFSYDYISTEDWRSNCGEGDVSKAARIKIPEWRFLLNYPLVAVDFIDAKSNPKAIDLNIAPGLPINRLNKYINDIDIANSIKRWFNGKE